MDSLQQLATRRTQLTDGSFQPLREYLAVRAHVGWNGISPRQVDVNPLKADNLEQVWDELNFVLTSPDRQPAVCPEIRN